jgi:transcriptional repressor NrdR
LNVIKKDGKREKFDIEKVRKGVEKSLEKRPVSSEQVEDLLQSIEARIRSVAKDKDIATSKVGEVIMEKLKKVDKVAYIRFASVYREFADLDDFKDEIKKLK